MTRHLLRGVVAIAISFVLLYYGIAWAVLRCSHDAKHGDHEVALQALDTTHQDFHHAAVNTVDLDLECVGPTFHIEAMAEASPPPQLDCLTPDNTPHVNDFLTLGNVTGDAANNWLSAVFQTSLPLAFPINLPFYLFLSILRI